MLEKKTECDGNNAMFRDNARAAVCWNDSRHSEPVFPLVGGSPYGAIGKYGVGPDKVYNFDYRRTSNIEQYGRNITRMKQCVSEFLKQADAKNKPFFLYIAPYDPHRAYPQSRYSRDGIFMNKWGSGGRHGSIKDWNPKLYNNSEVIVPFFLPDTETVRSTISEMYTSYNRMDQGIGLFMEELKQAGHLDDTLILWTSDNGIPFPGAKINLYEPGMIEPMMISSPEHKENWGKYSSGLVSTMDFAPTVLDWFDIPYPDYEIWGNKVQLTGKSLLPLAEEPNRTDYTHVYASHTWHAITMYYPMRVIRTVRYRLIHNINWRTPFISASTIFGSETFQEILENTAKGKPTGWYKTLQQYYYRQEWELYDLEEDPEELHNLAYDPKYLTTFQEMNKTLTAWQWETNDPFRCMPQGIVDGDTCLNLDDELEDDDSSGGDIAYQTTTPAEESEP